MTPAEIWKLVDEGRMSPEMGAKQLEIIYAFRKLGRRARLRRWFGAMLLAPFRWLGLTRVR